MDKETAGEGDAIAVQVIGLHILPDFATLYNMLDMRRCGYSNPSEAHHLDMLKYYSQEELDEHAVMGIEVLLKPLHTVRNKEAEIIAE